MKFAISCLLVIWPALSNGSTLFPNIGLMGSNLGSSTPRGALPAASGTVASNSELVDTRGLIYTAAKKHGVPAEFIKSIMAVESNFNQNAISSKGAIGLMQLMPETAKEYGVDPTIPEQNVDAGTHYLRVLMDKYRKYSNSLPRVIAAYNAGPAMVDRYHGVPPFRETRRYVVRVLGFLRRFREITLSGMQGNRRPLSGRKETATMLF
jgi:soluble lytic murein transglycosylase-like protein